MQTGMQLVEQRCSRILPEFRRVQRRHVSHAATCLKEPVLLAPPVPTPPCVQHELQHDDCAQVPTLVISAPVDQGSIVHSPGALQILHRALQARDPDFLITSSALHVSCCADEELIRRARHLGRELGIGPTRMQAILEKWPPHDHLDPMYVSMILHGLAAALQCKPGEAAMLVRLEHRLLTTPPPSIQAVVSALSNALSISPFILLPVCQRRPSVLFEDPTTVQQRLQAAATALQVPLPQLLSAARREPWIARASAAELSSRAAHLSKLLGIPIGPALLSKYACLVRMPTDSIQQKMQFLQERLQLEPSHVTSIVRKHPILLQYSITSIDAQIKCLLGFMQLAQLNHVLLSEPSLLARTPKHTTGVLKQLQQLLECSREVVADLVIRRPCLLTRSLTSLTGSYQALAIWRLSKEEKRELVLAEPLLLRLSSQEVHGRCRWLRNLMLGNGFFHTALRRLPPPLLGLVILHLPDAWSRLAYLAESSQETGVDVMWVVQVYEMEFSLAHPGYTKWLAWKCAPQDRSVPWRNTQETETATGWKKRAPRRKDGTQRRQQQQVMQQQQQQQQGQQHQAHMVGMTSSLHQVCSDVHEHALSNSMNNNGNGSSNGSSIPGSASAAGHQHADQTDPTHTVPMHEVFEVHEAKVMLMGSHFVRKPRRVLSSVVPVHDMQPQHITSTTATSSTTAELASVAVEQAAGQQQATSGIE